MAYKDCSVTPAVCKQYGARVIDENYGLAVIALDNGYDFGAAIGYLALFAAVDVMDLLLALEE